MGWTNDCHGTDHLTSGPMRGLEKMHPMAKIDRQTKKQAARHGDSMTESAQGPIQ